MTEHDERDEKLKKAQIRYYRLRNLLTLIGVGSMTAILIIVLLTSSRISNLAIQTHENTQTLINCTTPGHACYEQGHTATSGAVGTIAQVIAAAAFCVKNLEHGVSQADLEKCIQANIGN